MSIPLVGQFLKRLWKALLFRMGIQLKPQPVRYYKGSSKEV